MPGVVPPSVTISLDVIQISPGEQNRPGLRAAEFYDAQFSGISVPIIGLLLTTDDLL